jgi:hypothetical protein
VKGQNGAEVKRGFSFSFSFLFFSFGNARIDTYGNRKPQMLGQTDKTT